MEQIQTKEQIFLKIENWKNENCHLQLRLKLDKSMDARFKHSPATGTAVKNNGSCVPAFVCLLSSTRIDEPFTT